LTGGASDALKHRAERDHRDDNSVDGRVSESTSLLIVNYLVVRFLYKHRELDQFIDAGRTC